MEFQKKKKKKKSSHNSSSQQREGLFCKPTNNTPGNDLCTCVCLHVSMCVFWKQLNCSLWRSLPMYHPDDSGQAGCAASTAIELNDLVLHWIYCEWPAYHWCLAAGFWKREGLHTCVYVCACVHACRQIKPLPTEARVWRLQYKDFTILPLHSDLTLYLRRRRLGGIQQDTRKTLQVELQDYSQNNYHNFICFSNFEITIIHY